MASYTTRSNENNPPALKAVKNYVPPCRRKKSAQPASTFSENTQTPFKNLSASLDESDGDLKAELKPFELGGCADPRVVKGSIMDDIFIPRKASRLDSKFRTTPYSNLNKVSGTKQWDIGAVSECGVREANEDSYLIVGNLLEAFKDCDGSILNRYTEQHPPGLFCIFDGHLGDQAARYAAEYLTKFIEDELRSDQPQKNESTREGKDIAEDIVHQALTKLDKTFCQLCVDERDQWESGATALVAVLVDNHLIVGNLGDARAIASRSAGKESDVEDLVKQGWQRLPEGGSGNRICLYKEMSDSHHPSREDERTRIEEAGGWITYESDILKRGFSDNTDKAAAPNLVEVSRVCGELAVSRSLGDKDYKADFHPPSDIGRDQWDSPVYLSFPKHHVRRFQGDLISSKPEFQTLRMSESNFYEEFFLLACDGLWDVLDADDVVRLTRHLLFDQGWPASEAARRLAELAVHLGSSDNVTVIVVAMGQRK
mmetsp:Transcript_2937/g.3941  ORF Transcript_2937/g.3941 Transcript_2937/m.3941 type:complete len:485 (+) Transcript_2937:89-1543(+)